MKLLAPLLLLLASPAVLAAGDDLLAVGPGDLPKVWKLQPKKWRVDLDAVETKSSVGCAAVSFIIEPNGSTSGYKLLRSVPEGDYVKAAQAIVGMFRFEPGPLNPKHEAVFTYLTISFNDLHDKALGSNIRKPITVDSRLNRMCAVEGFDFGG